MLQNKQTPLWKTDDPFWLLVTHILGQTVPNPGPAQHTKQPQFFWGFGVRGSSLAVKKNNFFQKVSTWEWVLSKWSITWTKFCIHKIFTLFIIVKIRNNLRFPHLPHDVFLQFSSSRNHTLGLRRRARNNIRKWHCKS